MHTLPEINSSFRPAVFIQGAAKEIMALPYSELKEGKYTPEPLKSLAKDGGVPASILVDNNVARGVNDCEVHRHEADLWIAIDGTVHFEVGGALVQPYPKKSADGSIDDRELKAKEISGGKKFTLTAGDILYIPEGVPHVHWTESGAAGRLWIIKIPAHTLFPLERVAGWKVEPISK